MIKSYVINTAPVFTVRFGLDSKKPTELNYSNFVKY